MNSMHPQYFKIDPNSTLESLSSFGDGFANWQRAVMWWIGDLAKYAEARFPDTWQQVFPEWMSPGLIARCAAVSKAYPKEEDRNILATWSQHMQMANKPNRVELVAAVVDKGQTTDESRKGITEDNRARWLIAFDVHYFLHRHYYSGAGFESAMQVSQWIQRTVARLKEMGATDVLCAFEGRGSFRKELTAGDEWAEQRYKDRPPKPEDLSRQLHIVRELLEKEGFCCVSIDGCEADDVLASAANRFTGKTTIVSSDKDLRQCLNDHVNILLEVEWTEEPQSGELLPDYKWLTAKQHTEATGISPILWADFQCIMGDTVDGIKGVAGIGEKGAADLIKQFGNVKRAIQAARNGDESIKPKKREALLEFEPRLDVTAKLVLLLSDLHIPQNTRI